MKRSTDRILTTHVGSLVRPQEFIDVMRQRAADQSSVDEQTYRNSLKSAVQEAVRGQAEARVDVVSDGEYGKSSWQNYVEDRLTGYEAKYQTGENQYMDFGPDRTEFADYYRETEGPREGRTYWECTAPITYRGHDQIQRDIENFKAALGDVNVEEAFMPCAAPSSIEPRRANKFYPSEEAYVYAIAEAMREEYEAVANAGFLLQVDDAWLPLWYERRPGELRESHKFAELRMEALNHALRNIPEDRVRYHVCWGSWPGPHMYDVPLSEIVDVILPVKASAYCIESANPRHEHEWKVWETVKLPEGKTLVPGVVTHMTNVVEHPDLVAERLVRYAGVVGRENVMAGTDCGFAQSSFMRRVHPSIQWAKLRMLAEGAQRASEQLWR